MAVRRDPGTKDGEPSWMWMEQLECGCGIVMKGGNGSINQFKRDLGRALQCMIIIMKRF